MNNGRTITSFTNMGWTHQYNVFRFGQDSVRHGPNLRYWDKNNRRNDGYYIEGVVNHYLMALDDNASGRGVVLLVLMNANKKSSINDSIRAQIGVEFPKDYSERK